MLAQGYATVQEAARELNVTDSAVRIALLEGRLPFAVMFGRKLIARPDLAAYKQRTQPEGVKKVGRPRKATGEPSASTFTTQAALTGPIAEI